MESEKKKKSIFRSLPFIIILVAIIVAVLIVGVVIGRAMFTSPSYYAVYLDTGDLYFGKISHTPKFTLSDVWYLQRDPTQQSISLNSFSKTSWAPEGSLKINDSKIVWIAKVSKDSPIMSIINGTGGTQTPAAPAPSPDNNTEQK
jgi:hypothetical protein